MGWWIGSDKLSTEQREIIAAIKKNLTQVHWVQGAAGEVKQLFWPNLPKNYM